MTDDKTPTDMEIAHIEETMTRALIAIIEVSYHSLDRGDAVDADRGDAVDADRGDAVDAGRRLERINIDATKALKNCDAQRGFGATKLSPMTEALYEIKKRSSYTLDKGDVLGAGRRLERINIVADDALRAFDAQEG